MSFRCQFCNDTQAAGTRPTRLVTSIRERNYFGAGIGWEIAQEKNACEVCADRISATVTDSKQRDASFTTSERVGAQLADIYRSLTYSQPAVKRMVPMPENFS